MATRTSAPRAFTVPRGPDQLLDMSAMGARKRGRRRKSKHSFGSTSSCSSNLPSNTQANLPELFARLTLRHAANEDDRRRRDAAGDGPFTSKGCSEDEDTASTGSRPLSSSKESDGYRCTSADKGRPRRSRASSTSSGSSYATAVEGWEDDRDWRNLYATKGIWGQLPRSPRHRSRARREVMRTCDAEAQTPGWGLARIAELELMLRKRDAKIAELRERLKLLRACHAREVRLLRAKIEKILKKPPPAPPRSATRARSNRSAAKSGASEGARAQDLPQQPRRVLRQRSPPPRLRREEKPSTRPIVPTPRSPTLMDKECAWSAQWPPVPEFYELPGRNKNNTTVPFPSVESSYGMTARQLKTEQLISKTVQMVKKRQPGYTDQEIRRRVDHLRRAQGGFSGMTFNAIVALMLGNYEDHAASEALKTFQKHLNVSGPHLLPLDDESVFKGAK
ncbi:hypothetical protein HPB50_016042 [Hyalomma asiaticum]|uniref:Uncharacterized protein n=1 Tax=Hyalomma asiaticum TaxID=266040 RepID=A0ACB7T7T9_HYAAI|nr:hypothetical protein HPB50_016042 [Hyalomma asiaticum]